MTAIPRQYGSAAANRKTARQTRGLDWRLREKNASKNQIGLHRPGAFQ